MLTTPLTMDMLQSLLDVGVEESTTLDFKSDFDVENADHRRGLIDDACAMANTRGGSILLGVVESDRAAIALPGLMVGDLDRYRLRLSQMIENGLEPRLFGVHIELVAVSDGRYIVAVRIPQSWVGPHRTTNGRRFMVRGDAGNGEYDITGLRHAFLARDATTQVWERFRDQRIAHYYAGRLPVEVLIGPAALIHLVPIAALMGLDRYDMNVAATSPHFRPRDDAGRHPLPNLDGVVRKGWEHEEGYGQYVQIFRNGAVEGFRMLDPTVGNPGLALPWLLRDVSEQLPRWLSGMDQLGVPGPYQFAVTLLGVRGFRPLRDKDYQAYGVAAREDTLSLPPWLIETTDFAAADLLTELDILLHNAFGRNP